MNETYYFSATNNSFYWGSIKDQYGAGWPEDAIEVSSDVFNEFAAPKAGKKRSSTADGYPAWIDADPVSNAQLLTDALSTLAAAYKNDSFELNMAYVAAITNDGTSEAGKVVSVRSQITARKAQYISDMAAAKVKYPLE